METGNIDEELRGIGVYPSTASLSVDDFLNQEEALAQEEKILGKRVIPPESSLLQPLSEDSPEFLQISAKAGPVAPLDLLGRKKDTVNMLGSPNTQPSAILSPANNTNTVPNRRVVSLIKDHELEYPDLYMAVHVLHDWQVGKKEDIARFAKMFARSGCYGVSKLEDADLVIFSGGSDVDPRLYNEDRHEMTYYDSSRDDSDMEAYLRCREFGIPMLGVCRGAQFLHVMNGGKLFQDVDGHYGSHKMKVINDILMIENVTSSHHQMVRQNIKGGMRVIGITRKSTYRWKNNEEKETGEKPDVEAFFYRDTGCFGVQGHPEYANCNRFQTWVLEMINELFLMSPDYEWQGKDLGGKYRMKKDLIIERELITSENTEKYMKYIEEAYSNRTEA